VAGDPPPAACWGWIAATPVAESVFFFFFGLPETLLEVGVWAGLVGLFDQVFYSYFKYLHFS
jgi:hypothetical protein